MTLRLAVFFILIFSTGAWADLCRNGPRDYTYCDVPPANFVDCGKNIDGMQRWCLPSSSPKKKSENSSTNTAIAVIGGVAFVGVMWYLFRAPKSSLFDGQVKFADF
jgi:hypothetical protein